MFDSISKSFKNTINKLRFSDDEKALKKALDFLKKSLLKSDVYFKVVKQLLENIEKDTKSGVIGKDNFINAIKNNLLDILNTAGNQGFIYSNTGLTTVAMIGLQGAGKTTTTGKLAYYLKQRNKKVLLCACDLQRLAAVEQLRQIATDIEVDIFFDEVEKDPSKIAQKAQQKAKKEQYDVLIIDTAGRISIDDVLMDELKNILNVINVDEKFYVADSLSGQDASKNAINFNEKIGISGIILTKHDGDSKGGIAISIASQVQVPLRFIGTGEKVQDLEVFIPNRIVSLLLGEGDLEGLSEKASVVMSDNDAKNIAKKMKKGQFNFNDFLSQIESIKKMGNLQSMLSMMPGMGNIKEQLANVDLDNSKEIRVLKSAVNSMTPKERENPDLLMKNNTRKRRIAIGAGIDTADVNKMLKQFKHSSKMAKKLAGGGMKNLESMMANMSNQGNRGLQ
jgi:signal recognition particle subunit SRP54